MGTIFHMNDTNRPLVAACDHRAANTENPRQIYFYSKETKTIHLLQFMLHNVLAEAGSGSPNYIILTKPCTHGELSKCRDIWRDLIRHLEYMMPWTSSLIIYASKIEFVPMASHR